MAETATQLDLSMLDFELDFLESQFAESLVEAVPETPTDTSIRTREYGYNDQTPLGNTREPASEIYGRSLTTIHRLGAYMVGKSIAESINSPEAAQARVEFYTSVEEGFGTDMELGGGLEVRDFDKRQIVDGKVVAKDLKTPISNMTEAGLVCAKETASNDERFLPQLTRSHWDHQNALIVDEMARGETAYNTRIVVSPFPEEAAARSGDDYWRSIGYVPHLKRGFVQVYHVSKDSTLLAGSLSFDGSNKQKLHQVFGEHGFDIPQTEVTDNWLQYAITAELSADQAEAMAITIADQLSGPKQNKATNTVDITRDYGQLMDSVFNQSYVHICESLYRGSPTNELKGLVLRLADNSQHFNKRYQTALHQMRTNRDTFTDDDSIVLHELLVYSTIEMMRALHLQKALPPADESFGGGHYLTAQYLQAMDPAIFQAALSDFGANGARNKRVYSACGLSISLGDGEKDNNPQSAFGGADKLEDQGGKRLMNCPFCKAKVFGDPCAKVLSCSDCRARVVNGRVVNTGDGGSKARAHIAQQVAEQAREKARVKIMEENDTARSSTAAETSRINHSVVQPVLAAAGV